jgi:starch-binding outer membrane protein SusE/F
MKKISGIFISSLLLLFMSSCNKDGDMITLSGFQEGQLMATATDLVLSLDQKDSVMVTFAWTTSTLALSNPDMSVPDNILSNTLQASASGDFSTTIVESDEENLSKAYTCSEMNTLATSLGLVANTQTAIYFRLKASIGNNMEPLYSNVITLNVTPYRIDFTKGKILNSKKEETGINLYSATENGIYTGFMGATSWYNFFLQEGDGTVWGNDGVVGTAFMMSSDASTHWNFWFPGIGGCYYVVVNTKTKLWSALSMPTLSVSGDIKGDMTFDRPNAKWTITFTTTTTSMNIQLSGTGNQYDYTTGTTDASAISTPFGFTGSASSLQFASQAQNLTVTVPSAGTYTLVVNLLDPKALTVEAVQGTEEPEKVSPLVYLPGIDEGTSGSWTFNNTLKLYNEDNLAYAGVVNVNSLWGYSINVESGNWDDKYTLGTGDAYAGTLVFKGTSNLPAPTAGLYLIDVSLKALTYQLVSVGNVIYVSGLNDVWDMNTTLAKTATPGVYAGTVTISAASSWGFQIHLDTSWNLKFGGSAGKLVYKGSNITDDTGLAHGSYTMTVNLIDGTYSFTAL